MVINQPPTFRKSCARATFIMGATTVICGCDDPLHAMAIALRVPKVLDVAMSDVEKVHGLSESDVDIQEREGARFARIKELWLRFFADPACQFNPASELELNPESRIVLGRLASL